MSRTTIRNRLEAATPGEWYPSNGVGGRRHVTQGAGFYAMGVATAFGEDDAAFIAAARQDIPALLAVADAAREALDAAGLPDAIDARDRLIAALAALDALP